MGTSLATKQQPVREPAKKARWTLRVMHAGKSFANQVVTRRGAGGFLLACVAAGTLVIVTRRFKEARA